eukprot:1767653-Amphidinium_carterae.1
MPFKLVTTGQTTASLKSVLVVKVIGAEDDKPDLDAARDLFLAEGLDGLVGHPMGLNGVVPAGAVQWCVLNEDDAVKAVMLLDFPKRATVAVMQKSIGNAEMYQVDSTLIGSPRNVAIPIHFMLENMGGSLLLTRTLTVSDKTTGAERSL